MQQSDGGGRNLLGDDNFHFVLGFLGNLKC
jgi:hypothetical protein